MPQRWLWGSLAAGVGVGTILALWRLGNLEGSLDVGALVTAPERGRWVVPAVVLGGCFWLGLFTLRRVQWLRDRPDSRVTYRYGVAGFGPIWGLVMMVVRAVDQVRSLAHGAPAGWSLVTEVVLREAVIAFPFALWAGYVFGRVLTYFFRRLGVR